MVLINIDALSDSELRHIAREEGIEDWESLTREDLLENLRDFFGDDGSNDFSGTSGHKFISTLDISESDVLQLPGVEPLPERYNETFIHFTQRDPSWAYAFWGISANDLRRLEETENAEFLIRVCVKSAVEPENSAVKSSGKAAVKPFQTYDINISPKDSSWNIEFPWKNSFYELRLICRTQEGEQTVCKSNRIYCGNSWLYRHPEVLKNPDRFRLLAAPLISKDGSLIGDPLVREIMGKAFGKPVESPEEKPELYQGSGADPDTEPGSGTEE